MASAGTPGADDADRGVMLGQAVDRRATRRSARLQKIVPLVGPSRDVGGKGHSTCGTCRGKRYNPADMKANPQPAGESLGDLIAATGRGDREAFARLYEATGGRTYAIALRILGHHDLAEEAMQDAFLALWEKAGRYDPERGQAFAWIASIVRNRAIDRLRKHGERHHNIALADDVDSGQQSGVLPVAPPETQAAGIFECLDRLKNESREAILLVYYYGLSHDALAERLDAPLGTVKSWVRRGLLQLRDCLEE